MYLSPDGTQIYLPISSFALETTVFQVVSNLSLTEACKKFVDCKDPRKKGGGKKPTSPGRKPELINVFFC